MTTLNILDCSLRDGGYRNNWNFSLERTHSLLSVSDSLGIDYLEFGFKFPARKPEFGPFSNVSDVILENFSISERTKVGFMLETKAADLFPSPEEFAEWALSDTQKFDFVRIATGFDSLESTARICRRLEDHGKEVFVNVMRASELTLSQISFLVESGTSPSSNYYLADSFGSLYPEQTFELISLLRSLSEGHVGFHAHNNRGMALANSIKAIAAGANFIDGTFAGHGRGSGNARLEELVLESSSHAKKLAKSLDKLGTHLSKFEYPLGFENNEASYAFHFGAYKGFHPNVVMDLVDENSGLDFGEVLEILEDGPLSAVAIESESTSGKTLVRQAPEDSHEDRAQMDWHGKICILLGAGGSLAADVEALMLFRNRRDVEILSLNRLTTQAAKVTRKVLILHEFRTAALLRQHVLPSDIEVIAGFRSSSCEQFKSWDAVSTEQTNEFAAEAPADPKVSETRTVLDFAIQVCVDAGAREIILSGFGDDMSKSTIDEHREIFSEHRKKNPKLIITALGTNVYGLKGSSLW